MSRRVARALGAVTAATLMVGVTVVTGGQGGASPTVPTLRLFSGVRHVVTTRFPGERELYLPPAVYLGASGGAFEVDARLAGGHVQMWQVSRHGSTVTRLRELHPPHARSNDLSGGLPDFLVLTLRDAHARLVSRQHVSWCPAGFYGGSQRVDASGPPNPTFPQQCGSRLTHATVWGVDAGWAAPATSSIRIPRDLANGHYTLTTRVDGSYARQLQMPVRVLQTDIRLVKPVFCNPENPCPAGGTAARTAPHGPARQARASATAPRPVEGNGQLPDLVALPARDFRVEHDQRQQRDYLDFAATIWNSGAGQLDVEGFRHGGAARMQARQFVYQGGRPVRSAVIGSFAFDRRKGHHHWHLQDFARYDVLNSHGTRVALSHKQSFCLAPTDPINLLRPGADWMPQWIGLGSNCPSDESIWLRESLPAGWGDTYVQSAGGQAFDITSLPNGRYVVRVTTNPYHRILENDRSNDTSLVAIELSGVPGQRQVTRLGVVRH